MDGLQLQVSSNTGPHPHKDGMSQVLYPLSFNQRDMWFQRQIHGEGGLNNVVARIKIEGKLEVGRWREALQEVVAEQAALRTVFVEQEGTTYQRVLGEVKVEFQRIDLRGKTVAEQAEWMGQVEGERLRAGFDFERGPLFRAELWQTGEEEHEFAFVFNHLILDGVYMAELFEQVGAAYSRMGEGRKREGKGSRGKLHYGEYAQSQEQRLRGGELEEHEGYWRRQLEPPLPAMDLGFEGEAGPVRSFELGVLERRVEGEVWRGLRGMRKRYRTTVFRTVLAGLEVLLQRLTGEQEVLLGVPFTTRPAQAGAVLGFFGHAVPIRGRVTEGERLEELLQRVNEQLREAEEHVEYPLCEAVRGMKIKRDPHRPLFPVVISQIRPFRYGGGGLQLEMHGRQVQGGVYHLWVTVMEQPDGLTLGFYYNRELLHGEPILRIANCLQHLLADMAAHPDSCVGQLELLGAEEGELVKQLGQGGVEREEQLWAEQLISIRARAQADAVAVSDGREALSYGELNRRANQLANFLRGQGVGREDRVGILGQRRVGMLVTILGILKSGAGYVPLPASDPRERLLTMARSAGLKWIVADREGMAVAQAVGEQLGCGVMSWEQGCEEGVVGPEQWGRSSAAEPQGVESSGKDLAYVFYTSGSTGTPKGVMVERAGMLNHLRSKIALLGLEEGEVVAQNASYCFDISVWQFMAGLLVGGRVVIYDDGVMMDPAALMAAVRRDEVTILEVVPSYLELLLGLEGVREKLGKLRYLVSTAETLSAALAKRWFACVAGVKLVNAWGPTECSDDVAHAVMAGEWEVGAERVTVGTAIAGSQVYVVDGALQLLPAGATGEIAIGGVCVGRGYLGNAGATAQTFVPDPFGGRAGARLYLSGDLGRWRGDGRLEFLGRRDGQIKVRGHRLEVGEIEAAMSRQGGVRQAVVTLKSGRLVGYWVGEEKAAAELRQQLSTQLPDYMIPEALVRLEQFPRTGSGKLDRRSLPEPDWKGSGASYEAPRTELERQIAQVWQEVLGVEPIGIHDDFFDLGGHSLNAAKIALKLRADLDKQVAIRDLFLGPTVAKLAKAIQPLQKPSTADLRIPRFSNRDVFPLSPAQKSMWLQFHQVLDSDTPGWGYPQIIRIRGTLNLEVLNDSVRQLIPRHDVLRSIYRELNGEPVQVIVDDDLQVACDFHDLSTVDTGVQRDQLRQFLYEQLRTPITNKAPFIKFQVVRLAAELNLLIMQLPHIISDQWTERILAEDLASVYTSLRKNLPSQLPSLPVRYADFTSWQTENLDSKALRTQREYWVERFQDDFSRIDVTRLGPGSAVGDQFEMLPNTLVTELKQLARQRGTSLFVVLAAAFTAVLGRLSHSTDVVIGTPVSGRSNPDVARVAGLFINPLALRTDLSGDPTSRDLIDRVAATLDEGLRHQDYPFHLWVDELRRRTGRKDISPYSVVMVLEETTGGLTFGEAEASLESPRTSGLDVSSVAGPYLTLRICNEQDTWSAELVPGSLTERFVPAGLLSRVVSVLEQVAKHPDVRLSELDLLLPADHNLLTFNQNASYPDPGLVDLAETFNCVAPDGISARAGDGRVFDGQGEEWIDPVSLNRFLLRSEVTTLAATEATLLGLFRQASRGRQSGTRTLKSIVVRGIPSRELIEMANKAGCAVHCFRVLDDSTRTLLWADGETPTKELLSGWVTVREKLMVLDRWKQRMPVGIAGDLYVATSSESSDMSLVRIHGTGRWTPDGKLEVGKLENISPTAPTHFKTRSCKFVAPRTILEREIAAVWQEVLHVNQVGIDDDFCGLGGSAAMAVRAAERLASRNVFILPGQTMALRSIRHLVPAVQAQTSLILPLSKPQNRRAPVTALQNALLQMCSSHPSEFVSWIQLRSTGSLDMSALSEALRQLALRHDALRLCFGTEGKLAYAELQDNAEISIERVVLDSGVCAGRQPQWNQALRTQSDLVQPCTPSIRAILGARADGKGDELVLIASSLVMDEASWGVVVEDLERIYSAVNSGEEPGSAHPLSYFQWLQMAERLDAFADTQCVVDFQLGIKQNSAICRIRGSAYSNFAGLSCDEKRSLFRDAVKSAFPIKDVRFRSERRSGVTFVPDLSNMVGQFAAVDATEESAGQTGVCVQLLTQTASAGARFRFVRRQGPRFPLANIRVVGVEHTEVLFINLTSWLLSPAELECALSKIKSRLVQGSRTPEAPEYRFTHPFDTSRFNSNELDELLN